MSKRSVLSGILLFLIRLNIYIPQRIKPGKERWKEKIDAEFRLGYDKTVESFTGKNFFLNFYGRNGQRAQLVIKYKKKAGKECSMKKRVLVAIIIAAGILAGCGGEEPASSPGLQTMTPQPLTSEEPVATEEPDLGEIDGLKMGGENHPITERSVVNGQMQSYLTGEWKDADVVQRRNLAVMVPNNPPAMPQYGISQASIIYEAPVEGRITRLMCLFEDYDDLERIGPVRSSRDYYVYEAMAYNSIYCNWGLAVPFVGPIINTDRIDNVSVTVSGIEQGKGDEAYDRVSRPGYATEFTGYLFIDGYEHAVDRLGYAATYEEYANKYKGRGFEQAFTFADEGYIAAYQDYPDATKVYPGGTGSNSGGYGSNNACFTFNPEDRLYYRSQYGKEQIDEYTGEQLAVTNVVFKVCHGEVREPADKDYLAFAVHGTGTAYVFTNGKVIEGTWQRNSDYDSNVFLDKDGNEIVFNQGKTWICCIWEEFSEYMEWE